MTPSTDSASMAMRCPPGVGAAVVGVGLGGVTARQNCDGSQPCRVGQAADQASVVGQADAGTTADSSELKATHRGASCTTSHTAVPASEPDGNPPGPPPPHSQFTKADASARSVLRNAAQTQA